MGVAWIAETAGFLFTTSTRVCLTSGENFLSISKIVLDSASVKPELTYSAK